MCVASCADCDDCARQVCVPDCAPLDIAAITVNGPEQVAVGRQAQLSATAQLSDGSSIDVTYLVDWQSSDKAIATVDSWGTVTALAVGSTTITATAGGVSSAPVSLSIVQRPALRAITIQNSSCFCGPVPFAGPADGPLPPCLLDVPAQSDLLPVPDCGQVVLVGSSLQFRAIGEFADGSYDDLTEQVDWRVDPAAVADVSAGLFTARQAGTAKLSAALDDVVSDATEIRVVSEATLTSISIYPGNWGFAVVAGGPVTPGAAAPCFDCGAAVTVLRGDELHFQATGHYDTGEWRDLTTQVTWRTTDATVATIDTAGVMTAVEAGTATIDATLGDIASNPVDVQVVNQATLLSLSIYQEGGDRVVAKDDQLFFHATGYYDVGFARDVTDSATWVSSDQSVGGFDAPGVFTGRAAGTVQVAAQLDGQRSNDLPLEVFQTSALSYCDPSHINRGVWSDDFNRVVLESDCASYRHPASSRCATQSPRPSRMAAFSIRVWISTSIVDSSAFAPSARRAAGHRSWRRARPPQMPSG